MKQPRADRIIVDPEIMVGKPIIKGTRIPVDLVLKMLAQGISEKEILKEYPRLKKEDIQSVLQYASAIVSCEEVFSSAR